MAPSRYAKIIVFIYLTGTGFIYLLDAPQFLTYADDFNKSQAVILFLGGRHEAREKQAMALLKGGFAEYLLIPTNHEVFRYQNGGLQKISWGHFKRLNFLERGRQDSASPRWENPEKAMREGLYGRYSKQWENTHVEVFLARKMMEALGLHDALMVSSPLHMRRIKIISSHVFNLRQNQVASRNGESQESFLISFVPTPYERQPDPLWFLNPRDFEAVATEYVKIAWFQVYSLFGEYKEHGI